MYHNLAAFPLIYAVRQDRVKGGAYNLLEYQGPELQCLLRVKDDLS